jgi:ABC-type cobalamin transport system ATPase subunit
MEIKEALSFADRIHRMATALVLGEWRRAGKEVPYLPNPLRSARTLLA